MDVTLRAALSLMFLALAAAAARAEPLVTALPTDHAEHRPADESPTPGFQFRNEEPADAAEVLSEEMLLRTVILALFPSLPGSTTETESSGKGGGGGGGGGGIQQNNGGGSQSGGGTTVGNVPEPATLLSGVVGCGLIGAVALWRRRAWRRN